MTQDANADQREFWSGPSGQIWIENETAQDALLGEVARVVISRAALGQGDAVVDIGCGTGALSLAAAEAVGRGGRVLATDISKPLLGRAAERLAPFPQARAMEADAAVADWPDAPFDHAISRFGVMFFADPPAAFANIARALRPGGRMTFASWAPARVNPYWSDVSRIAVGHLGQPPRTEQDAPGPMGLADRDLTVARFEQAGLVDVSVEPVDVPLVFAGDAEDLARQFLSLGPAARVAQAFDASEVQIDAIRADLTDWVRQYENGGDVRIPAVINLISARRA